MVSQGAVVCDQLSAVGAQSAFSFQFFTRLAAVFAEEVDGFWMFVIDGPI